MSSSSNKIDLQRDFASGVYLSEAPPYKLCLGSSSNFVGSEPGLTQCVKLLLWCLYS